ncbi:hypothetical protein PM082_023327 [Marasmius tenuissimus]|nr:hypothetical protein PM082_023327 [Marasmius tenuissimus]
MFLTSSGVHSHPVIASRIPSTNWLHVGAWLQACVYDMSDCTVDLYLAFRSWSWTLYRPVKSPTRLSARKFFLLDLVVKMPSDQRYMILYDSVSFILPPYLFSAWFLTVIFGQHGSFGSLFRGHDITSGFSQT